MITTTQTARTHERTDVADGYVTPRTNADFATEFCALWNSDRISLSSNRVLSVVASYYFGGEQLYFARRAGKHFVSSGCFVLSAGDFHWREKGTLDSPLLDISRQRETRLRVVGRSNWTISPRNEQRRLVSFSGYSPTVILTLCTHYLITNFTITTGSVRFPIISCAPRERIGGCCYL